MKADNSLAIIKSSPVFILPSRLYLLDNNCFYLRRLSKALYSDSVKRLTYSTPSTVIGSTIVLI
nr:MAG TPA: hypothetical protein [Bacteriophage sp.]